MSARLRLRDLLRGRRPDEEKRDEGQSRRIVLVGERIDYRLIRARRKTIGMQVGLDGLTVRAPRWVPIREIEIALFERDEWVVRSLAEWRGRRRDVLPRAWKTGAPILYLGRELKLAVNPARTREIAADLLNLSVLHPAAHDERQVAAFVGHWLRDEAQRMLAPCVADFAARITKRAHTFKLSNARSEWGSCNEHGVIRLNWRLIQLPPHLARYVAAHEVAHLVELNHSKRFWSLVEALFPGHAEARGRLDDWTALLEA
ncbi:MAG TPA: SprT family zinc-dependent metalloprotease [Casimicrobiaceae bacterium]|nr:SprT family zinc-dependent metalloprotease [Casimicrobiaceae bacterium]